MYSFMYLFLTFFFYSVLGYIIEKEDIEDNTEVTLYVNDNLNNKIEIPCKIEKENQLN